MAQKKMLKTYSSVIYLAHIYQGKKYLGQINGTELVPASGNLCDRDRVSKLLNPVESRNRKKVLDYLLINRVGFPFKLTN